MAEFLAKIGMTQVEFWLGVALLVVAIALIALVLLQSGKDKRLSGSIAGAAETFFGKSKAASNEKKMTIATVVLSIVFVAIVFAMYLIIETK